jgi:hypothetical protein
MSRRFSAFVLGVAAAAAVPAGFARAEVIYVTTKAYNTGGPDYHQHLISFDSATPGAITDYGEITGLGSFQYLEDIDFRPATGELYGLGYTGSVYKIDLITRVATSQGFPGAPGSGYNEGGIDFNPVTDRLRIMEGNSGSNYNFNPNTGTGGLDTSPAYVLGDPNVGRVPNNVAGIAYDNNVAGALTTTLYSIDASSLGFPGSGILGTITPPASGQITTVGNLGVVFRELGGFDISGGTGIAYAAINGKDVQNVPFSTLYTINLATGLASPVGQIGIDNSQFVLTGLSVAPVAGPGGGGPNGAPLPAAALAGPVLAGVAGIWSRRWRKRRA